MSRLPLLQGGSFPIDPQKQRVWRSAGAVFCLSMLVVHLAAGMNMPGMADFWRDFYWATVIAHGEAWPSAGPPIYQMIELGPWWFYLLALPVWLTGSSALTMVFIQALSALKYFLAWRIGTNWIDARFGLVCAVGTAIAGWSLAGFIFPSHIALVETCVLLLVMATVRCARTPSLANGLLLGLTAAVCLHAHPTTLIYVVAAFGCVLWRNRSRATLPILCVAGAIILLSLLPPLLDRDAIVAAELKPLAGYVGQDIGQLPLTRIPVVAWGIVARGAWWGLLLDTTLKPAAARMFWWLFCACLLIAASGVGLLRGRSRGLRAVFVLALCGFMVQVAFVVLLRPVTPVWMIPSCLPPLALAIAVGWYGWIGNSSSKLRRFGTCALIVYAAIVLAPFSFLLRDHPTVRVMPGVNPFFNVGDVADHYIAVPVAFYPLRRIDHLSASLCEVTDHPAILHARLAAVIEPTFGSTLRNACGHWPDLGFGGEASGPTHIAGLFAAAATASGVTPTRVSARMALYDMVRPIAPSIGGHSMQPRRLQIDPDSAPGPIRKLRFDFETKPKDAVVLTNRLPMAAMMQVDTIRAGGHAARLQYDDGSSRVYLCDGCISGQSVHWELHLRGIEANLDLVILPHDQTSVPALRTMQDPPLLQ